MILEIIAIVLGILVVVLGFTTFNLLNKNEKAEDILVSHQEFINKVDEHITFSEKRLRQIDERGVFKSDDEIGWFFNEMIAIQTHDGLYDAGNEKYLKRFMPEQRPRTSLPYILHQADMLAARVEWEKEWLPKFSQNSVEEPKKQFNLKSNTNVKSKALNKLSSPGLKNMLDNL